KAAALLIDDPEQALPKLQRTVELCGNVPNTPRLRLAEYYLEHGRESEAEREFQQLLQSEPTNPRAHLGLARSEFERAAFAKTLPHLEVAAGSDWTKKNAHALLAEVRNRLGDPDGAERERRQAENAPDAPQWPDPYLEEASRLLVGRQAAVQGIQELLAANRLDEALAAAQRATQTYPESAQAWLLLGQACLGLHDDAAAELALTRAVELDPNIIDAQFLLGTIHF